MNNVENALSVLGSLKSIKENLDDGFLIRFEDIVYAEAFSDLVERAEYLFEKQDLWKARFVPQELGRWRYSYVFENNEGVRAIGSG